MAYNLIENSSNLKFAKLIFNKGTDDAFSFHCLIKKIEPDNIQFLGIHPINEVVKPGSNIDIKIYSTDGVVAANATLLEVTPSNTNPIYLTTYPAPYDYTQKREYYRADLHVPAKLLMYLPNGQQKKIEVTTKNISGRGMCFVSLEPEFPKYHSITVNLKFNNKYIVTTADFVHTQIVNYKGKKLYIHALKFMGIDPDNINFIAKECFLFQIEARKNKVKV